MMCHCGIVTEGVVSINDVTVVTVARNAAALAACGGSEDHRECVHVEHGEDNNDILTRLGKIF